MSKLLKLNVIQKIYVECLQVGLDRYFPINGVKLIKIQCPFCETPCGNKWCPYTKEEDENQYNENERQSSNSKLR